MLIGVFREWWKRRRYSVALRVLRDVKNGHFLDLGVGSGEFLSRISTGYKVGIDIYPLAPHLHFFILADIHQLPLRDDYFDVVACLEVIEHVSEPRRVVDEIHRVLKDGGTLLISTPDASLPWRIIWYLWTRVIAHEWWDTHRHSFRLPSLLSLLHGKFAIEEVRRANFFILTLRSRAIKRGSSRTVIQAPSQQLGP